VLLFLLISRLSEKMLDSELVEKDAMMKILRSFKRKAMCFKSN
jgi:hypothetical protein